VLLLPRTPAALCRIRLDGGVMKDTAFARRFSSVGFRLWRHQSEARLSRVKVYRHINGFIYVGLGPIAIWKDGRRLGCGRR